jgi:hypothetical protein
MRLNTQVQRFALGVAAGLTAQALAAFWRWLRQPAPSTTSPARR